MTLLNATLGNSPKLASSISAALKFQSRLKSLLSLGNLADSPKLVARFKLTLALAVSLASTKFVKLTDEISAIFSRPSESAKSTAKEPLKLVPLSVALRVRNPSLPLAFKPGVEAFKSIFSSSLADVSMKNLQFY
ncbi:MAG: hypothetical protein HC894_15640 [Microcoleus sp. SM1_3_4]|nr:hypothetical protein [Microcoleus sp. SM1_3_4]